VDPPVIAALVAATASLVVAIVNAVTGQRRETRIKKLEQEFEADQGRG